MGVDWGLHEAVIQLSEEGVIPPTILVLIWNTKDRIREYMPAAALRWLSERYECWHDLVPEAFYNPTSDLYLEFLVNELKPYVDANFRTLPGQQHTAILGSSMGGLISLYAVQQHPDVFGGAACLSTHWPAAGGAVLGWLRDSPPQPERCRLYHDAGTEGRDAEYGIYHASVDEILLDAGFCMGSSLESRVFEGAGHNEAAWRERVRIPLRFIFGSAADHSQPAPPV